jgi:hypothetical protein
MFHGSVPADLRSLIHEHAVGWEDGADVYVGCSGNYTIERVLQPRGFQLHSNDVQAYSSALGFYFADGKVPFDLKPEADDELGWVREYLDGEVGTLAVLMLGTTFLDSVGKPSRWHQRQVAAYRGQFPTLHAKTVQRLRDSPLKLASYSPMDVREWLDDRVPEDAPVAMFPPFFAGDYEQQFKALDKFFDWPQPEYPELDEEGKDELIQQVVDRRDWTIGLHIPRDDLRDHLRGVVQTTNRGVPIYVYSAGTQTRIVRPRQVVEPIPMPKVSATDDLSHAEHLGLHVLTGGQFAQVRSQFMSKQIKPGSPWIAVGVSVDGKLAGAFAYGQAPSYDPQSVYLLSDFPVSWSRHRRLSKLIVMAALSTESRRLAQRTSNILLDRLRTTAYTNNPQSQKYGRGVPGMKLEKRDDADDGIHRYQLNYVAPFGEHTLAQMLDIWQRKHAADTTNRGD